VAVGRLRQIEPEHMHFAYETLVRGTRLEGSKLEMRTLPLTGTCRDCEWRGEIRELFFCCAACGSNRGEFEGGMELLLESLEIEEETPRAP
jgi:hydrogenase nickel incorporation protein HypA/HybF